MFWKSHITNKHIKCSCYFTLTFIIIIIIINNIIFGLDQFLPAYCSTVSQTADTSAGVEVLSCECRTSAVLKSLSHLLSFGICSPQRSLCRLSIYNTKKPISCPRKLNAAISTRGTFEDCYMNIPLLRGARGPPTPLFCVSPFSGSELKKWQMCLHGSDGCHPDPAEGNR